MASSDTGFTLSFPLTGKTRVAMIIGDPIEQVKSPSGVTQLMQSRGRDWVVVPAHVCLEDFPGFVRSVSAIKNLDALLITVPHKFAAHAACATYTARSRAIGTVNVMRRNLDGSWHGDMCDGEAHVRAMQVAGAQLAGKRALLVGAGGAGSAIAFALAEAGVSELGIYDPDQARLATLLNKLSATKNLNAFAASNDPQGYDAVSNATPLGMRANDPMPVDVSRLSAGAVVGDVVTAPSIPPFIAAARAKGNLASTGTDMFAQVKFCIADFLVKETKQLP